MKKKPSRKAPSPVSKTLLVYGNVQAEAVAVVLRLLHPVSSQFQVVFVGAFPDAAKPDEAALREGVILCEQQLGKPFPYKLRKDVKRVRFPALEFDLLWPLGCANPFDAPEPPSYPFGRFPYGDSFIVNCIQRDLPAEAIAQYYSPAVWPATWPNLDKLFRSESARLSALDARNDVKIGSFILKYFRRKLLFCAPNNPSNNLLAELIYRLLHACFGADQPAERADIEELLSTFGPGELLGMLSVPIHPLVARHFNLDWYKSDDCYAYFGRKLTYDQYFSEMINRSLTCKNAALAK